VPFVDEIGFVVDKCSLLPQTQRGLQAQTEQWGRTVNSRHLYSMSATGMYPNFKSLPSPLRWDCIIGCTPNTATISSMGKYYSDGYLQLIAYWLWEDAAGANNIAANHLRWEGTFSACISGQSWRRSGYIGRRPPHRYLDFRYLTRVGGYRQADEGGQQQLSVETAMATAAGYVQGNTSLV